MTHSTSNTAAWQEHAEQRVADHPPHPRQPPTRMQWTQQPGRGPAAELLGELTGRHVLELGCGPGHNLAHLVDHHHATGIGIDAAPAQIHRARVHYGHLPGLTLITADAAPFLTTTRHTFDAIYCAFGALGLSPPEPILAGIHQRLRPGGLLAFSVSRPSSRHERGTAGPVPGTLALPDGSRRPITRWTPDLPGWTDLLTASGFTTTQQHTVTTTPGPGCLIITAHPT
jgi:SAM-dependent methyltransferase